MKIPEQIGPGEFAWITSKLPRDSVEVELIAAGKTEELLQKRIIESQDFSELCRAYRDASR